MRRDDSQDRERDGFRPVAQRQKNEEPNVLFNRVYDSLLMRQGIGGDKEILPDLLHGPKQRAGGPIPEPGPGHTI